jgi:non-ribosomal peptide synthetase component E (peptide arylation enzyme)
MVREPLPGVVDPPAEATARYTAAGVLGEVTLGQALHEAAQRFADRTALVGPGRRWTYRELDTITDKVAAALLGLGLRPLDRVMMQIGNVPEFFFAAYGCFKAGLVPVCTLAAGEVLDGRPDDEVEEVVTVADALVQRRCPNAHPFRDRLHREVGRAAPFEHVTPGGDDLGERGAFRTGHGISAA